VTNRTILAIPALARRVRGVEEGHALVLAENGKPIIARLTRCIDGKAGPPAPNGPQAAACPASRNCLEVLAAEDRSAVAEAEARHRWIAADQESYL
jgi:type IV secretion system protein VirD4